MAKEQVEQELREKIAKVIYTDWGFGHWEKLMVAEKNTWLKTADQILTLIKEAGKEVMNESK